MMKYYLCLCMSALLIVALTCPQASADRVDDLEKLVKELAEQNKALSKQVDGLQTEVRELRGGTSAPAVQTQLDSLKEEVQGLREAAPAADPDAPKYSFGGDWRLRGVSMDNMWNFDLPGGLNYDDSWEWFRMRSRAWFKAELNDGLSGYFRGANEYKWGIDDKGNTLAMDPDFDSLLGNKEWFVDAAYMDWNAPFGADWLSLRLGRQDLIYGEGFLILDGQSNVGSMAIGFDAAKAVVTFADESTIDFIYSKIYEGDKQFSDDEDFYAIYGKTDRLAPVHLEPYLLYRNRNEADDYTLPGNAWPSPPLTADHFIDPELDTWLIGGRATTKLMDGNLMLVAEGGYQWGEIEDPMGLVFTGTDSLGENSIDRDAWAAYGYGRYTFNQVQTKPYLKAGYYLMSGDDPDTEEYEGWDSFYAEWPQWSEGLIYQLYDPFVPLKVTANGPTDRDLGSWTNMRIAQVEAGFSPMERLNVSGSYAYLWADEENSLINPDEDERGQLLIGLVTYQLNKYLSGHLLGEYFMPGDYYDPAGAGSPDDAFFMRYQMMLKF